MRVMALALAAEPLAVEAEPEDVGMSSARLGNVSRLVQRYIDEQKLPGAISLVARRGKVVHFETYGEMDAERHKPMRADTIFRFYSMTKPIASVALMTLYEEGRFQLDDPASEVHPRAGGPQGLRRRNRGQLPGPRAESREMTVRDLLMHTSGLVGRETATPVGELYRRAGFKGADSEARWRDMVRQLGQHSAAVRPRLALDLRHLDRPGRLPVRGDRRAAVRSVPGRARSSGRWAWSTLASAVPASKVDRFAATYAPSEAIAGATRSSTIR